MAWTELESILLREGLAENAPLLLKCLHAVSAAKTAEGRTAALDEAVSVLATDGNAIALLRALANDPRAAPRSLALELASRMTALADGDVIAHLRPLLRDRWVPTKIRLAAAVALCRSGTAGEATQVLHDFVAGFGKSRFLKQVKTLRIQFAGRRKILDRYAARLVARMRLGCPDCGVKLPPAALAEHLWDRHQKLLVGRHIRSPWNLIDRWATEPGGSPANAHRQLLRLVRQDDELLTALRRDTWHRKAGLCPHCFTTVPLDPAIFPAAADVAPLNLSAGRLSGHGFVVELTDSLRGPRLRVESPNDVLFDGPEPHAPPAIRMRRLAATPMILVTFVLAATFTPWLAIPATLVTLIAAGCLAAALRAGEPDDRTDRLVDHAWRELVPQLNPQAKWRRRPPGEVDPAADAAGSPEADFLAALSVISHRHGDAAVRERALHRCINGVQAAVESGAAVPIHLIELRRLQVEDAAASGGDPVGVLADAIRPCFTGTLTPAAADLLLDDDLMSDWTRGQRARLRVLLAARAFAAGFGVWDLHALGRAVPRLGHVLNVEDTDGLARLRLIWDLRPTRPWRHCGPAATVFELAAYPMLGGQHLETVPDLLLFQPMPAGGEPVHLLACGRGLIVGGGLIHEWPTTIETRPLPGSKGGGYDLRFGPHSVQIHGNVENLLRNLNMWGRYFFGEFLPWIGNALTRSGEAAPDRLGQLIVTCPECGKPFLGRRGGIGRPTFAKSSRPFPSDSA